MSSPDVANETTETTVGPDVDQPEIVGPPPPEWLSAPTSGPPARRAWLRHWTVRLWTAALVVAALLWPLMVAGGVAPSQAGRVALVIVVQALGGALLWRLARGPVAVPLAELIGAGLAVGTLLSLLAQQLLRVTPLAGQAWWLPAAAAALLLVVLVAIPGTRRRLGPGEDCPLTVDEVGGVVLGVGVGLASIWSFWRATPLSWKGWWAYYVDIPYHEGLAHSVTTWGPFDNILAVGSRVRYHWFADAWAGTTTDASAAAAFVVMTRALPLVAILGTVCLVWAWARRLSDRRVVPILAVLLTVAAMNVGNAHPAVYTHIFTMSPSLGLAALWLLGGALVFTEHVHARLRWSMVFLALFAVGCVGGKTSNATALLGGLGLAAVAGLWLPSIRRRLWSAFAVGLAATSAAFVMLILGSSGNLTVQAGATARNLGILPDMTWLGIGVGTVGAALVFGTTWVGVVLLAVDGRTSRQPDVWFAAGAALTGLLLMAVLGHPNASQLYFPISSGLVVATVSAWGIGEAIRRLTLTQVVTGVVLGVVAGEISSAVGGPPGLRTLLPARVTELGPYAVWGFVLAAVAAAALRAQVRGLRYRRGALRGLLGLVVITASLVAGQVAIADILRAPRPTGVAPNAPLAWTAAHRASLAWLRDHSAQDDVIVTNRQCSDVQLRDTPCRSSDRWFLTSALTGRRMYVEGADYAISQPHPSWIDARVTLSRRFVDTPNEADARVLWNAGVRWVVVDLASTRTRSWASYARPAFTTATTEVLRLDRP